MKHKNTKFNSSLLLLLLVVILLVNQNTFGQLLEIENKTPKNVAIEVEFENQDSTDWAKDLKVKVTNVGKKPIYFLLFTLTIKNEKIDGIPVGYALKYGADHLYSRGESLAQDEDISILPNESYTFKIENNLAEARKRKRNQDGFTADVQSAILNFWWLNFGDGTGIMAGGTTFKKNFKRQFFLNNSQQKKISVLDWEDKSL